MLTPEIKEVLSKAPFIPLTTVSPQGEPHTIVVGKVTELREDNILGFGIYKMEITQQNINANGQMQVIIAATADGPKGYRLTGKACIEGKLVLFKGEKVEELL